MVESQRGSICLRCIYQYNCKTILHTLESSTFSKLKSEKEIYQKCEGKLSYSFKYLIAGNGNLKFASTYNVLKVKGLIPISFLLAGKGNEKYKLETLRLYGKIFSKKLLFYNSNQLFRWILWWFPDIFSFGYTLTIDFLFFPNIDMISLSFFSFFFHRCYHVCHPFLPRSPLKMLGTCILYILGRFSIFFILATVWCL